MFQLGKKYGFTFSGMDPCPAPISGIDRAPKQPVYAKRQYKVQGLDSNGPWQMDRINEMINDSDKILKVRRGMNPAMSVNYTQNIPLLTGGNHQFYSPYAIKDYNQLDIIPMMRQEDLLPLNRLPREKTAIYVNRALGANLKEPECGMSYVDRYEVNAIVNGTNKELDSRVCSRQTNINNIDGMIDRPTIQDMVHKKVAPTQNKAEFRGPVLHSHGHVTPKVSMQANRNVQASAPSGMRRNIQTTGLETSQLNPTLYPKIPHHVTFADARANVQAPNAHVPNETHQVTRPIVKPTFNPVINQFYKPNFDPATDFHLKKKNPADRANDGAGNASTQYSHETAFLRNSEFLIPRPDSLPL